MDPTVRRYIARILLLHLAFLVAVAAVVAAAGIALYATAQANAESAAIERATVPVNQTKDLLERHFQGIFSALSLADRPGARGVLANPELAEEIWSQTRNRLSALVEINAADLAVVDYRTNPDTESLADSREPDEALPFVPRQLQSTIQTRADVERLAREAADWLRKSAESGQASVSGVIWARGDSGREARHAPVILVALPLTGARNVTATQPAPATAPGVAARTLLVGVVPVAYIEENFLYPASQRDRNGMLLFDATGRLVAGGGDSLAGRTIAELVPENLPPSLGQFIGNTITGQSSDSDRGFEGQVEIGLLNFDSTLATARVVLTGGRAEEATTAPLAAEEPDPGEPADRPEAEAVGDALPEAARQAPMWIVVLINRDAAVAPLEQTIRTAILWALAMVVAISAILVSTAVQLIRARSHLERLRTEMIDREMREARQIQLMWLPDDEIRQTATRQLEIAAQNVPASHISGDFYNYFDLPDGRTALVVGDVTGHGLTAAFLMATTQLLVRGTLLRVGDPGKALEEVNNQLCMQAFHGQFVTIQLIVIDPRARQLLAASAGHPPPLTCDREGNWYALDIDAQLVLGVMADTDYPTQTIPLDGTQTLLLYTDGVTEVKAPDDRRFSLEQLLAHLKTRIGCNVESAKDLVEQTFAIVKEFSGDAAPEDDLTLLAVHLAPRSGDRAESADGEPEQAADGTTRGGRPAVATG